MDHNHVPIQPAATVVCTRQNKNDELEVLLLRRNRKLKFASGFWVFPGGKIEETDCVNGAVNTDSAKLAAIREAEEEADLKLHHTPLIHFMNWTTPTPSNKRFNTWFFICEIPHSAIVTIDDSEIKDHKWVKPAEIIKNLKTSEVILLPPTFLTLVRIMHCQNFDEVKIEMNRTPPMNVIPKTGMIDGTFQSMYEGDAGYESHDVMAKGPRHRITGKMNEGTYGFEYHGCDHIFPANGGYKWQ